MITREIIKELRKLRKTPYVKGTISLGSFEVMSAMLDHCEELFDAAEQGLKVSDLEDTVKEIRLQRAAWEKHHEDEHEHEHGSAFFRLETKRRKLEMERDELKKEKKMWGERYANARSSYVTLEVERDELKRRVKKLEPPTSTIALVATWRQRTERAIRDLELTIEGFCAEGGLCGE